MYNDYSCIKICRVISNKVIIMRRKEFLKDYKLEPTEENGKIKTRATYIGEKYSVVTEPKELLFCKILIVFLLLLSSICILVPMLLETPSAYVWYVILPGICALLLVVIMAIKISSIFTKKKYLTRKESFDVKSCKTPLPISRLLLLIVVVATRIAVLIAVKDKIILRTEILGLALTFIAITCCILEIVAINMISIVLLPTGEDASETSMTLTDNNITKKDSIETDKLLTDDALTPKEGVKIEKSLTDDIANPKEGIEAEKPLTDDIAPES